MKLGFFMLFFLLFNSYVLIMSIIYLNTERFWLWIKSKLVNHQKKQFEKRIHRIEKRGSLSKEDKIYFHNILRSADRLWAFHLAEEKASPAVKLLLEQVYTEGLVRRFKKVLKLPPAAQFTLISRIPQVGFMNNTIKTSLLKSLQVEDHDIRMLTLYVIARVNSANYFLEALEYISGHHLGYNIHMLAFLIKRSEEMIDDLTFFDLIKDRRRLSSQVREAIIVALSMFTREEREPLQEELRKWFLDEENSKVRPDFYALLDLNSLSKNNYNQVVRDLKSNYDTLRLSALKYSGLHLDEDTLSFIKEDLMKEMNVDIIYEEVRLLLSKNRLTCEDCQAAESYQVLRTYKWMIQEGERTYDY